MHLQGVRANLMWVKVFQQLLSKHQPAFIAVLSFNHPVLLHLTLSFCLCSPVIKMFVFTASFRYSNILVGYGYIESFCFYFMFPTDTFQFCNPLVWLLLLVVIVCSVFFLSSVLLVLFFSWCLVHCHWLWLSLTLSICLYFEGFFLPVSHSYWHEMHYMFPG